MILPDARARRLKAAGCLLVLGLVWAVAGHSQETTSAPRFKVIAFYTGTSDLARVSFVREANRKTNKELLSTFSESAQNTLITNALLWLGDRSR